MRLVCSRCSSKDIETRLVHTEEELQGDPTERMRGRAVVMWHWPKRPTILPEVLAEFDLHGVDAVRAVLANSSDGSSGTSRDTPLRVGNAATKRGEIQDWLKWKSEVEQCWIKVGVIAAAFAAVFSLITVLR